MFMQLFRLIKVEAERNLIILDALVREHQLMDRIFSGIQPSGNLQLGNYLGAIRNWARMQQEYECIFCVVDLHAITLPQNPRKMREATREVAAGVIAGGVDPKNCKEVLEQMLKFTNSRIFQSYGRWYIINNSSYSEQSVKDS